jgi:hypothetical protein
VPAFQDGPPDAMYQRPMPSVTANFMSAPITMAQMRTVPKFVPATSEEIISPAPTPVTAMTFQEGLPIQGGKRARLSGAVA